MKTLRVYIDFKSPAAYLAFKPTLALAERKDLTLDWQPIRTRQQPVPAEAADEDRGTTHRRVRAQARRDTHLFYAQVQGVPMRFPTGAFPETDLALACLGATAVRVIACASMRSVRNASRVSGGQAPKERTVDT